MRLFIKNSSLFLILLVILAFPIDYAISKWLASSKTLAVGDYPTWNYIYSKDSPNKIAIYGSSRAELHFDPKIIENAFHKSTFNYGMDGHNFWLQYLRHKELLNHQKKPEIIILSVDIFSLEKRKDLYNYEQFLPYMFLQKNSIEEFTKSYQGFKTADYKIPLMRYNGKADLISNGFFRMFRDNDIPKTNGFIGQKKIWNGDFDKAKKNMKSYRVNIDSKTKTLFETFIKECKKENIKLILVYTPEYYQISEFAISKPSIISYYQKIAKKNNLHFLDYSNDTICYNKDFFYNASHLNAAGAKVFTEKFVEDLKKKLP